MLINRRVGYHNITVSTPAPLVVRLISSNSIHHLSTSSVVCDSLVHTHVVLCMLFLFHICSSGVTWLGSGFCTLTAGPSLLRYDSHTRSTAFCQALDHTPHQQWFISMYLLAQSVFVIISLHCDLTLCYHFTCVYALIYPMH